MEDAERMLKELVYNHWRTDGCEGYDDTLRFTSAIDFFIPYFPLQKPQVGTQLAFWTLGLSAGRCTEHIWQQPLVWRQKSNLN